MNQDQKISDNLLLLEHLAAGARRQVPLPALVSRLAHAEGDQEQQRRLTELAETLSRGAPLGEALQHWPGMGRDSLAAWLQTAEAQGQLPEALALLCGDLRLQERRTQQARMAMVWPATILVAALGVSLIVTLFVMPQLNSAFDALGMDLPAPTRFYFASLSLGPGGVSLGLALSLLMLAGVVWMMFARPDAVDRLLHALGLERQRWDLETQLRLLPVASAAATYAALPQYLRYLGDTTPVPSIRRKIERAVCSVEAGEALPVALEHEQLVTARLGAHLDVAQRTGNLSGVRQLLELQLHERWALAAARFERNLTGVVYLVAAFLAFGLLVSVYLPIFKLGQAI